MMTGWKPSKCPTCGGTKFSEQLVEERMKVSEIGFVMSLPAVVCKDCGESLMAIDDMGIADLMVADWLARHGVRTGKAFRFMRKALGMKAADLAELMSSTPETISRWERGHLDVDPRAFALLGELVADRIEGREGTLERLKALNAPAKPPKRAVRVELPKAS